MKLLTEIIAELIIDATPFEPADSPFMKEGTDTGYPVKPEDLCNECKAFGFCKRGNPERFEAYKEAIIDKTNI